MKKYINVLLLIEGRKPFQVQIDTTQGLHELQIYEVLEQMFPVLIFINMNVD